MPTYYNIQETTNGLRIRTSQDLEQWERLLGAIFGAIIVGAMSANFLGGWWLGLSATALGSIYFLMRSKKAELLVTKVEFITRGDLGKRVRTPRIICTGDVRRLQFCSGNRPLGAGLGGLYVETHQQRICVLPFLDFHQTVEVIRAIEAKFRGLAQGWRQGPTPIPCLEL